MREEKEGLEEQEKSQCPRISGMACSGEFVGERARAGGLVERRVERGGRISPKFSKVSTLVHLLTLSQCPSTTDTHSQKSAH